MKVGPPSTRKAVRKSRRLIAGQRKKVKLRLSKKTVRQARRRLSRGRSVRAVVRVVARDRAGHNARAKQRIRLVPARR